jgi:hypothetical protein
MNRSLLEQSSARHAAIEAIDKFEESKGGKLSKAERKLLDRLKSKISADKLGLAWGAIQKHFKRCDDDQRVIASIVEAWLFATTASKERAAWDQRVRDFNKIRKAIGVIEWFLAKQPPVGLLNSTPREQLVLGLSWLDNYLHSIEEVAGSERLRLSRVSGSVAGQRAMFAADLAWRLRVVFDHPCHSAVARLTEIAFETEFRLPQAIDAERDHAKPVVGPLNEPAGPPLRRRMRGIGRRPPQKQA